MNLTLAVCEVLINARFDYVDAYTHTKKRPYLGLLGRLLLPRAFFGKSWFLIYAHRLVNVGYQLLARRCGKRLIEIVVYQVYARN